MLYICSKINIKNELTGKLPTVLVKLILHQEIVFINILSCREFCHKFSRNPFRTPILTRYATLSVMNRGTPSGQQYSRDMQPFCHEIKTISNMQ